MNRPDPRPLVAHILYRFAVGGLENGVVNLINRMPADRYRHAVIALTEVTDFKRRIERDDVTYVSMHKPPGQGLKIAGRMAQLLRELRPTVVHTRNIAALEMMLPAAWARVPVRVHGEHGWDVQDPDGTSLKYRLVRRCFRPFVHRYVALSAHLERYLRQGVGVPGSRVSQIYNGVDTRRFFPVPRARLPEMPWTLDDHSWVVGTVGRLQAVKDQALLVRATARALELQPGARAHLRTLIAGDGPSRAVVEALVRSLGLADVVWLAGERNDVPQVMRALDAFVLSSRAEGISNTILEAMATALPVTATDVGGNGELIQPGQTGRLVPRQDVDAMAQALLLDLEDRASARATGQRARQVVEERFSLDRMVRDYVSLYDELRAHRQALPGAPRSASTST